MQVIKIAQFVLMIILSSTLLSMEDDSWTLIDNPKKNYQTSMDSLESYEEQASPYKNLGLIVSTKSQSDLSHYTTSDSSKSQDTQFQILDILSHKPTLDFRHGIMHGLTHRPTSLHHTKDRGDWMIHNYNKRIEDKIVQFDTESSNFNHHFTNYVNELLHSFEPSSRHETVVSYANQKTACQLYSIIQKLAISPDVKNEFLYQISEYVTINIKRNVNMWNRMQSSQRPQFDFQPRKLFELAITLRDEFESLPAPIAQECAEFVRPVLSSLRY